MFPGDIIEICDSDYAGVTVADESCRSTAFTRTLTLDREVEIPPGGNVVLNPVGSDGQPVTVAVTAHPAPDSRDRQPVTRWRGGVQRVEGLKLPDLRQRLFRCVAIRENDDGTYAITAVQHVPEKASIVDNGRRLIRYRTPVSRIRCLPLQHLTTEILAEGAVSGAGAMGYPRVVKGLTSPCA